MIVATGLEISECGVNLYEFRNVKGCFCRGYDGTDSMICKNFMLSGQYLLIYSSKIFNSLSFKYNFSFPTFTDFKNPFSSNVIK